MYVLEARDVGAGAGRQIVADSDIAWQNAADKAVMEALPNAQARAAKWAETITALTGIFGAIVLIKGPEDITKLAAADRRAVENALVLGVALASLAILFAGLAAQGWSTRNWSTGSAFRASSRTQAAISSFLLLHSRFWTVLAVVLIGYAIYVTWTKTPLDEATTAASSAIVLGSDGRIGCGQLTTTDGRVAITATDGDVVDIGPVQGLAVVESCPGTEIDASKADAAD
jgi:nitrate reductase NapE component